MEQIKNGTSKKLVGFENVRQSDCKAYEYEVYKDGEKIGVITSGEPFSNVGSKYCACLC